MNLFEEGGHMKSRFNVFRVLVIFVCALLSPALPIGFISGTSLSFEEQFAWTLFFSALMLTTFIYIWILFLTRLVVIQLEGQTLKFKNLISRSEKKMEISENLKIKYSAWFDTTVFLLNNQKVRVTNSLYKNLNELIEIIKKETK